MTTTKTPPTNPRQQHAVPENKHQPNAIGQELTSRPSKHKPVQIPKYTPLPPCQGIEPSQYLTPQEVELARTQLQDRIQKWYRRSGQNGTHAQPQLPRRTTTDQQPCDSEPSIPTPRKTAHYLPGENSPIIIDSRTPTPTSPAYNRNSPTNNNPPAASTTAKPGSLGRKVLSDNQPPTRATEIQLSTSTHSQLHTKEPTNGRAATLDASQPSPGPARQPL